MSRQIRYGSRARLGYILPSVNLASECQLPAMAPPGVSLHFTRLKLTSVDEEALRRMADGLEDAVMLLKDAGVASITFHCTSVTTYAPGTDERLIERIRAATGLPATATGRAVIAAFRALGATRVVLVTPYPQHVNHKEEAFLGANGIGVVRSWAEGINEGLAMFEVDASVWRERTIENRHADADAYFLSCTQIRSVEVIDELEAALGKPVVTSTSAALWQSLRMAGIEDRVEGYGRLLIAH